MPARTGAVAEIGPREETGLPAPLPEVARRARVEAAGLPLPVAGGEREAHRNGAKRARLPAVIAEHASAVATAGEIAAAAGPVPVLADGPAVSNEAHEGSRRRGSPAASPVAAARPSPASEPTRPIVLPADPAPMTGRPEANPGAPARAAAIASYLDGHMPAAAAGARPSRSAWPDRAAAARPSRDQIVPAPTVRVHIGQIRVEGPPAAPRPRFSRPSPSLGLADYIQRRQGR
jgi:hypothetical protein